MGGSQQRGSSQCFLCFLILRKKETGSCYEATVSLSPPSFLSSLRHHPLPPRFNFSFQKIYSLYLYTFPSFTSQSFLILSDKHCMVMYVFVHTSACCDALVCLCSTAVNVCVPSAAKPPTAQCRCMIPTAESRSI